MTTSLDPSTKSGAGALDRLASEKIGWMTTVNPDGQPQSSPLWFLWTGDEILVYSQTTAPRLANIAANPRAAFNLHTDPGGDSVLSMEGTALIDPDGPLCSMNPPYVAKYGSMLADSGSDPKWMDREYPVTIRITPTRWRVG
jgi:PPOX class probable F420-dependent enzyme